ncbi:MAG: diaminopimelate epimerase [Gammaproteobacteria bacterium]|nr:diaminopimelate epimerase [Gammaproteobacteria bacterium]
MDGSFTKMHGLGNDFLVMTGTPEQLPTPARVRMLADRRTGVGFDQLMVVLPAPDADHDAAYRIFNADGSEAGQCGNGARCVARWVAERDGLSSLRLASPSGTVCAHVSAPGRVDIEMGVPDFSPAALPFLAGQRQASYRRDVAGQAVEFGAVSMGNPHAVIPVADVSAAAVGILGPALERHPDFPDRVNVGFMQVIGSTRLRLRVHERGVGETRACGTGACAAVAVGRQRGQLGAAVTVELPGGELEIRWQGEGETLWMSGEAVRVYEGRLNL